MKKTKVIIASALCVLAWSGAQAANRTWGDGTLPDFLAVYDVDTNGVLSVEEIQAMKDARRAQHDDWLARWDTNGDGVIDEAERAAARDALQQRIEDRRTNRFAEADADSDGCLTLAEFSAIPAVVELARMHPEAPAHIYARLDADTNQCVSVNEFLAHLRDRPVGWRRPEVFIRADGDTNRCLTLVEFSAIPEVAHLNQEHPGAATNMYAQLDANHDNCLSPLEFIAPPPPPPPPPELPWNTAETYARADVNANACLTLAEFGAIPEVARKNQEHPGSAGMLYGHLDVNHDACLTVAEFTVPLPLEPQQPPPPPGT